MKLLERRRERLKREIRAWEEKLAGWDAANYSDPKRAKQALTRMQHGLRRRQRMLLALDRGLGIGGWTDVRL